MYRGKGEKQGGVGGRYRTYKTHKSSNIVCRFVHLGCRGWRICCEYPWFVNKRVKSLGAQPFNLPGCIIYRATRILEPIMESAWSSLLTLCRKEWFSPQLLTKGCIILHAGEQIWRRSPHVLERMLTGIQQGGKGKQKPTYPKLDCRRDNSHPSPERRDGNLLLSFKFPLHLLDPRFQLLSPLQYSALAGCPCTNPASPNSIIHIHSWFTWPQNIKGKEFFFFFCFPFFFSYLVS